MNETTILYFLIIIWIAPSLIILTVLIFQIKKLKQDIENFIEENLQDDQE